ncbi:MAG: tRNA (N6-isopentenyl adenosine(37)-C2)-methylthiotransferase MiaB [Zetaproteobacteria bacterium]|nr:tRNA (N6-isopentenyl adenosine(37)-C2)-methylthiotransferase MiaB [Pseudobdellovibrionaceae bacterium]
MQQNNQKPATSPRKKILVETWGCQMNVADSEKMLGMLQDQNYETTQSPEEADLVLLNTCHIREKAKHKVVSRLGRLREIQKKNKNMKIAVAGCVAQAEGKKLLKQTGNIDILVGPGKIDDLPKLIEENQKTGAQQLSIGFKKAKDHEEETKDTKSKVNPSLAGKNTVSRYVNIAQGCDNFCTFCVVPFTRGREISLHPSKIIDDVTQQVESGAREVTLLGQNVNSYGHDLIRSNKLELTNDGPFVNLLRDVAAIDGLQRLRFTTSNPHDFTLSLAKLFRDERKLGKYIHLPVQSGSDVVLERMKRKVTVAEYYERINWLQKASPEIAISTDLIVGFPGETEEQFEETVELVKNIRYSFFYAFKYSTRKGTAAARFLDQIPEEIKSRRLAKLMAVQDKITIELNKNEIGNVREVLFQYESSKEPGIYYGRTEQFRLVRVKSNHNLVGELRMVEINDANKTALVGSLL